MSFNTTQSPFKAESQFSEADTIPLSSIEVAGSPSSFIFPIENSSIRGPSTEEIPFRSSNKTKEEGSYIFIEGLFTRDLLPEISNKEREFLVSYTTCNYQKREKVQDFKSSNFARYYKSQHPDIATNKKLEETKKRKRDIVSISNQDFFTPRTGNSSLKRQFTSFTEEGANNKILNFIIENNLSFWLLSFSTFQNLLNYYNSTGPVINKDKIKIILSNTFNNSLLSTLYLRVI
ncbi:hypothetical protein EDB80DRAFT_835018 [Ilyonectria destructans]|nr:hypothetical protein EDB80DRAFT_835018 [Ilyonectria destructans]